MIKKETMKVHSKAIHSKAKGFTLIEVMITVTIIGILAAIALPSYQNYIIQTRRVEAQGLLLELSSYMERFFTENGRYDKLMDGSVSVSLPFSTSPKAATDVVYDLQLTATTTGTTFDLTATPKGNQTSDTRCGTLAINQAGVKCILNGTRCSDSSTTAHREAVNECW